MDDNFLWIMAEKEVSNMGLPPNTKGYYYIVYGAVISLKAGLRKVSMSKEVYTAISDSDGVSAESVDKCITNAIKFAWERSERFRAELKHEEMLNGRKPTNSEIISIITQRLRLERKLVIW